MDIQEILNKVIDGGYYTPTQCMGYMCLALENAQREGTLNPYEYQLAQRSIDDYLEVLDHAGGSVACALVLRELGNHRGLRAEAWCKSEGAVFYRNWADRPIPNSR